MVAWIVCACGVNRLPVSVMTHGAGAYTTDNSCPACKRIAALEADLVYAHDEAQWQRDKVEEFEATVATLETRLRRIAEIANEDEQ